MKLSKLLPRKFSTRLMTMTLVSGLIPILIFSLLMSLAAHSLPLETHLAIRQGQEDQWRRSEGLLRLIMESSIHQKAKDVALQLDLYLQAHPQMTLPELQVDPAFREIAVQPVGTGYTSLHDSYTGINRFHKNPVTENMDLGSLSKALSDLRSILEASLGGRFAYGYYRWKEPDGTTRNKFISIVPISRMTADGVRFSVSATTYTDEFFTPLGIARDVSIETTHRLMHSIDGLIRSFRNLGFLFMAMGIVLAMALAYWAGTYFSRSINQLREATKEINQGFFDVRLEPAMSGDMGELTEDFNQMVLRLATTTVKEEELEASEARLKATNEQLRLEIQERSRVEEELRESEERFRKFADEASFEGIIIHDEGKILDVNRQFAAMHGYERDELISGGVFITVAPESREMIRKHIRDNYEKSYEALALRKDGTTFPVEINAKMIPFHGRTVRAGAVRDISERKASEAALRESEELFRSVVENSHEGIFIADDAYRFVFVNNVMCTGLLFSPEEIIGQDFRRFLDDETRQFMTEHYLRRQRGEHVPNRYEFSILRKDGERRSLEMVATAITDSAGRVKTIGQVLDTTDQKRAAEEKKKMEARLQRAQKMEAIGTLAGGVAHDLNNILAGLVSYPELLLMDLPQESPLRRPILTIQKAGERAAAIVQDLLTLARRGVAATEVVNVNEIISEYLKSPEHENLTKNYPRVRVKTGLEENLLDVMGSPIHLAKTLMNLVTNAAEAMPEGGEVLVTTENRYVDSPIKGYDHVKEGDYVTLSVADSGIGIPHEDIERIFEPFYTKKVMGRSGTGLGLAVVWGTVKDHEGYIDVESHVGKGTTFTVYLPVTRRGRPQDKMKISIANYRGAGESILVVDDVEEQRRIASGMLTRLGYAASTASSGEEAVEYMRTHSADLLLLDMIMDPGMDGLETYKKILEIHPGQKAIIVSGFSETGKVKEAQRLGAGDYVRKPYLLERLGLAVRRELDR